MWDSDALDTKILPTVKPILRSSVMDEFYAASCCTKPLRAHAKGDSPHAEVESALLKICGPI